MLFKKPLTEHFYINAAGENSIVLFESIDMSVFRLGQSDMGDRIADDTRLRRDNRSMCPAACLKFVNNVSHMFFYSV